MTSQNSNQHTLYTLREQVNKCLTLRGVAISHERVLTDSIAEREHTLADIAEAQQVIQHAAEMTQQQLQHRISDIITLALASIFEDPYTFKANFTQKRNNVECDLLFERRGEEIKPLDDSGFGTADVASLALRFSVWKDSDSRAVLFFDEPMRNLSAKYRQAAGTMIKMLSDKLQVQVICVTHLPEIAEMADKVFLVNNTNDVSTVEVEDER